MSSPVTSSSFDLPLQVSDGREIKISMHTLLVAILNDIKGPSPDLRSVKNAQGLTQVIVSIDTDKINIVNKVSLGQIYFESDLVANYYTAEDDVCIKAINFLITKYDLVVIDFSHDKVLNLKSMASVVDKKIKLLHGDMNHVIDDWISHIAKVEDMCKKFAGSIVSVASSFASVVSTAANQAHMMASWLNEKQCTLAQEEMWFFLKNDEEDEQGLKRIQHVAKIPKKVLLDEILKGIPARSAKYLYSETYNGQVKALCKVDLSGHDAYKNRGNSYIEGEPKRTVCDAESSAASYMILFLEKHLGLLIIDFNYNLLQAGILEFQTANEKLSKMLSLGQKVCSGWEKLVKDMDDVSDLLYDMCLHLGLEPMHEDEPNMKFECVEELNPVLEELRKKCQECTAKIQSHMLDEP